MKRFLKTIGIAALVIGFSACANAQNSHAEETAKEGFMKRAFRDMKESAKLQRQIDKANFKAQKLETRAFYEEQKRLSKPSVRTEAEKERMQKELEKANQRVEAAKTKADAAKKVNP